MFVSSLAKLPRCNVENSKGGLGGPDILCFKMSIKNWLCVVHLSMPYELLSLDY